MPCLEEVLSLFSGRVVMNVHIRDNEGGLTRQVCDLLRERVNLDLAYLALGSKSSLAAALDHAPDISRACLLDQGDPSKMLASAKEYKCGRVQFFRQVTKGEISQAHDAGLICNLFWSDEPEDARGYVRMGIDVVLTNCAHKLIAVEVGSSP
jgi:glycerophosphoryl diester phosphodiesterase